MAENADGSEKSEEPTEKKLRESREKGQVPRSRELTTLLVTLSAAVFLLLYGAQMIVDFEVIMVKGLSFDRDIAFDTQALFRLIGALFETALYLILPFLLLMTLIALVAPILLGGWSFSVKAISPKLSKLNPISGIKRMFSTKALLEKMGIIANIADMRTKG